MTLKELARLAGVSPSTVSRVVNKNDPGAASPQVRDQIWALVRQTGYLPNGAAQSLKTGSTTAGAVRTVACIFARTPDGRTDPFFSQIFRAVEHACNKLGFRVTETLSAQDFAHSPETFFRVDGVVLLGRCARSLLPLLAQCKHVVYTGLNPLDDRYDQVICDGYGAARLAVRHLRELGHRHIGYIGEKDAEARYRGYYDAMQELRLPLCHPHIVDAPQSVQGGYQGAMRLLTAIPVSGEAMSTPPSAIFCANDLTAVGVLQALKERNVRVPGDISVISIDNTEMAQNTAPMLTAIDIPKEELGRFAVKLLADRMAGGHRLPVKLEVPYTLISRESCTQAAEI